MSERLGDIERMVAIHNSDVRCTSDSCCTDRKGFPVHISQYANRHVFNVIWCWFSVSSSYCDWSLMGRYTLEVQTLKGEMHCMKNIVGCILHKCGLTGVRLWRIDICQESNLHYHTHWIKQHKSDSMKHLNCVVPLLIVSPSMESGWFIVWRTSMGKSRSLSPSPIVFC